MNLRLAESNLFGTFADERDQTGSIPANADKALQISSDTSRPTARGAPARNLLATGSCFLPEPSGLGSFEKQVSDFGCSESRQDFRNWGAETLGEFRYDSN